MPEQSMEDQIVEAVTQTEEDYGVLIPGHAILRFARFCMPQNRELCTFDLLSSRVPGDFIRNHQYRPKVQLGQWQALHIWHRPPSARLVRSSFVILSPTNT